MRLMNTFLVSVHKCIFHYSLSLYDDNELSLYALPTIFFLFLSLILIVFCFLSR